jgi:uncharacterized protein
VFLVIAFGATIGVSLGVLGGGGSILAVPALVYGLGQPIRVAVPTSLLVVGSSALAGALSHLRADKVPWLSASLFGASGIAGSFAGAWMNHRLDQTLLLVAFAVVMLAAAAAMLRKRGSDDSRAAVSSCENAWRERPAMVIAVGVGVGVMTGLFGVGGGFIVVPAWTLVMGCPVRVSVGASLFVIVLNSTAAFVSHMGFSSIDLGVAVPFAVAGVVGAVLGERFSDRLPGDKLSRWFAYLVIGVALFVLIQIFIVGDQIAA